MVIQSFAKINLSLSVNKRLKNGLHDIQSIYCLVDLKDKISIKKAKNKNIDQISFQGPLSKDIKLSDNSIIKLLYILRKIKLVSNYYSINIVKNIPTFSGFGGGTSNAAAVLNFLIKKRISKRILNKIIRYVGSDLRLFFHKQGYLKNINTVLKFKKRYKLNFLLVYPRIKSSTKDVFSNIKKYSKKKISLHNHFKSKNEFIDHVRELNNDLQSVVVKKHPQINKLLKNISKIKGCFFSRMTGSGSACYGLFINKNSSIVALKKLRKKYPKFWFSIAKTI